MFQAWINNRKNPNRGKKSKPGTRKVSTFDIFCKSHYEKRVGAFGIKLHLKFY